MKYSKMSPAPSFDHLTRSTQPFPALLKITTSRLKRAPLPRGWSNFDLGSLLKTPDSRMVESVPTTPTGGLDAPQRQLGLKPQTQLALHELVATIHQGVKEAANKRPAMAPGLAVIGKLTRSDDVAAFRSLFIDNPGKALKNIVANATALHLSSSVVSAVSELFLAPNARAMLFDLLMLEPITANVVKLLSAQPVLLRAGLKMHRAMLCKVLSEGRPPEDVRGMSPVEVMQATKRLFQNEKLSAAQVTIDNIVLAMGHKIPALVGTLIQELFVDDKHRLNGFAGEMGSQVATQLHRILQTRLPHVAIDLDAYTTHWTQSIHRLADTLWQGPNIERFLSNQVGTDKAHSLMTHLRHEGTRLVALTHSLGTMPA